MTVNESDVRIRLQNAALALFQEHGYDRTTAAEIAARAGVTERTFFRHFPDKREVLFQGQAMLRAALTESIAGAPATLAPLATLFRAFRSVAPMIESNRPFAAPRQRIIAATPALHERELAKMAALCAALGAALKTRGAAEMPAALAASAGMAAFVHATLAWLEGPDIGLADRLDDAERSLAALLTP